jgi:hypothetical protein
VGEAARVAGVAAEVAGMGTEDVRARLPQPTPPQFFHSLSRSSSRATGCSTERDSLGELPTGGSA